MHMRDRWSLVSLPLGLVLGAGCGLFGLRGDDSVVQIQCVEGQPVLEFLFVGLRSEGSLSSADPDTLSSSCGGADGPDRAFQIVPSQSGTYDLRLFSDFDAVLYGITDPCGDPREDACVDDIGSNATEVLTVELVAGVPYVVVVDGFTSESQGMFTLEAMLVAEGGDTDSDGETGEPMGCDAVEQTIEVIDTAGSVQGSTWGRSDAFLSMCGAGDALDDAWRFVPPAAGLYQLSLTSYELQGSVSVRDASCSELVCDDGGAAVGSPHMPALELFMSDGEHTIVVSGAGEYQLFVTRVPDSSISPTCRRSCSTAEDCGPIEGCLDTTEGQVCLPYDCEGCFTNGLTCWSYPHTCGWIACS